MNTTTDNVLISEPADSIEITELGKAKEETRGSVIGGITEPSGGSPWRHT